jgi:hypothetical protein
MCIHVISESSPSPGNHTFNPVSFRRKEGRENLLGLAKEGLFLAVGGR